MHHFNVRRDGRQRRGCVGETLKAVRTRSIDDRSPMPQPPGPHRPRREPLESRECANNVQRFSAAEASRVVRPGGVCRSSPSVRSGMGARPRCAGRGPGPRPAGRAPVAPRKSARHDPNLVPDCGTAVPDCGTWASNRRGGHPPSQVDPSYRRHPLPNAPVGVSR